jgi:hypothetical protein
MKSMQDEQLEFDSEEMDLQEFDWEDIRMLRLPRLNAVRLETIGSMTGSLLVSTNQAVVLGATTNTYPAPN